MHFHFSGSFRTVAPFYDIALEANSLLVDVRIFECLQLASSTVVYQRAGFHRRAFPVITVTVRPAGHRWSAGARI